MVLFAIAAGISAIGSAAFGVRAAKKEASAAKREQKAKRLQKFVEQRRLLREARQAEATALASGVSQGVGIESSGVQGVLSSLATQKRDQFTVSSVIGKIQEGAFKRRMQAAQARTVSGVLGGLSKAAFSMHQAGGTDLFKRAPPTGTTAPTVAAASAKAGAATQPTVNASVFVKHPGA